MVLLADCKVLDETSAFVAGRFAGVHHINATPENGKSGLDVMNWMTGIIWQTVKTGTVSCRKVGLSGWD